MSRLAQLIQLGHTYYLHNGEHIFLQRLSPLRFSCMIQKDILSDNLSPPSLS